MKIIPFLSQSKNYDEIAIIGTGATLKSLYFKLFHMTCVVQHVLHNCPMKVKFIFEDVDQQIAKLKVVTIKIKPDKKIFYYCTHAVTRWENWLNALLHFTKRNTRNKSN